jgi:hypothetical protein
MLEKHRIQTRHWLPFQKEQTTGLTKEDSFTMDLYFTSSMTDVGIQEHEDKIVLLFSR